MRKQQRDLLHRLRPTLCRCAIFAVLAGLWLLADRTAFAAGDEPDREPNARELYNDGARKLAEGKLPEAESYLQSAVASQDDRVQPAALYNLGHARFQEGLNELTNSTEPGALGAKSASAMQNGAGAIHDIDDALAGENLQAMVAAYQRGRGARKELKGAIEAVQRAMDTYSAVLTKWRRASGDFRSAAELQPAATNAQYNAGLTDRYIARLVDMMQMMMPRKSGMGQQREELRKKMAQLKGKIPDQTGAPMMGDNGDDDDDGDTPPKEPKPGDREGPVKNGVEMQLTPEEAQRLLGLLQLDTGRKLMLGGFEEATKPRDPKGRDW
jgi:tetratricopeptide (TPR) repeat protein